MKEIYRSFEGKLNVENQNGYIVYELKEMYEIHELSVWGNGANKFRVQKNDFDLNRINELLYIGELYESVDCGRIDGQIYYKDKWRSPQKIMDKNKTYKWRMCIR